MEVEATIFNFSYNSLDPMRLTILLTVLLIIGFIACEKPSSNPPTEDKLSYGDSIFYLRSSDYYISPVSNVAGTYSAFPEGLELEPSTGRIRIGLGKSETGMRYKIRFTSSTGKKDSTMIVVAGVNYFDKYYNIPQNDSIAYPLYNASYNKTLPAGSFTADNDKVAINPQNGQINLKQTWRNGFANDLNPADPWKEIKIEYRLNDASNMADNEIRILLYYYNNMGEIAQEIKDIVKAHETMLLGIQPIASGNISAHRVMGPSALKPRPPCVIIVGN